MPITANKTEEITGTGDWILIGVSGEVQVQSTRPDRYAYTPNSTKPTIMGGKHMSFMGYEIFQIDATLENGRHLWINPPLGQIIIVTSTDGVA